MKQVSHSWSCYLFLISSLDQVDRSLFWFNLLFCVWIICFWSYYILQYPCFFFFKFYLLATTIHVRKFKTYGFEKRREKKINITSVSSLCYGSGNCKAGKSCHLLSTESIYNEIPLNRATRIESKHYNWTKTIIPNICRLLIWWKHCMYSYHP